MKCKQEICAPLVTRIWKGGYIFQCAVISELTHRLSTKNPKQWRQTSWCTLQSDTNISSETVRYRLIMYQSAQHLHQQHTHRNDKTPHLWPYVFFSIIQILVIKISWNWKYNFPFFSQLRNEHFPPNSRKWMLNNQNLLTWVCFWNVINIAIYSSSLVLKEI